MVSRLFVVLVCVSLACTLTHVAAQSRVEYYNNGNCSGNITLTASAQNEHHLDCFPLIFGQISGKSAFRVSCGANQPALSVALSATCQTREQQMPAIVQDDDECCVRLSDEQSVRVVQCDGTATACESLSMVSSFDL
jgi:hypothetical protein